MITKLCGMCFALEVCVLHQHHRYSQNNYILHFLPWNEVWNDFWA